MVRKKHKKSEAHMKMNRRLAPKTWRLALKGAALSHYAGSFILTSSKKLKGSLTEVFYWIQNKTYLAFKQPSMVWWLMSFQRKEVDSLSKEIAWEVKIIGCWWWLRVSLAKSFIFSLSVTAVEEDSRKVAEVTQWCLRPVASESLHIYEFGF